PLSNPTRRASATPLPSPGQLSRVLAAIPGGGCRSVARGLNQYGAFVLGTQCLESADGYRHPPDPADHSPWIQERVRRGRTPTGALVSVGQRTCRRATSSNSLR